MAHALFENDVLVQLWLADNPPPDYVLVPEGAQPGYLRIGGEVVAPPALPPTPEAVNAERDRRVHAGFPFGGKTYAFDPASKQRVTGAGTLAGFAIANGAQPGDAYWHGGTQPFRWIADDNSLTEMDAQTCFAFGQAAAAHEEAHIFAARAIKDMSPIPVDYASNESYWP